MRIHCEYLLILSLLAIIGCAITRTSHVTIQGNNIKTPYGTGDVNTEYNANTTWSFLHENPRSQNNTSN